MKRINSQDTEDVELAKQVLSWISYAKRPLTVIELRHALAIVPEAKELDVEALMDKELLLSVCAGIVTIEHESNIIRLVHYTTQEYFERKRDCLFPDAQTSRPAAWMWGRRCISACREPGHDDVVKRLVDAEADLEARDQNEWTALIRAAGEGHDDVVKRLVDAEADLEARDEDGGTALSPAAASGHDDVDGCVGVFDISKQGWQ